MKTHHLFCGVLSIITCCVFTCSAQTALGETLGYIAVVISLAVISKGVIAKMDA